MARLDDDCVQSMVMGKVFKETVRTLTLPSSLRLEGPAHLAKWVQTARINSLDFYKTGEHLVTASDDESIHVYNAVSGKYDSPPLLSLAHPSVFRCRTTRTVLSKKYGVDLIRWTHNENTVICASKNSWDGTTTLSEMAGTHHTRRLDNLSCFLCFQEVPSLANPFP